MNDKKIENFLITKIHLKPDKIVFDYLVRIVKHWESGGTVKGSLTYVSSKPSQANQALYRHIQKSAGSNEYFEITNSKYPMSPNSFLAIVYEKYFGREE